MASFGLTKVEITADPAVLGEMLNNPEIEVISVDTLNEEMVLITYKKKDEFEEEHDTSNIVLSLWTTAAGRLHLHSLMKRVAETPGCRLLYTGE
jgi:hypothetical protein